MKRTVVMTLEYEAGDKTFSCTRSGTCTFCDTRLIFRYLHAPVVTEVLRGDTDDVRCPACQQVTSVEVSQVEYG